MRSFRRTPSVATAGEHRDHTTPTSLNPRPALTILSECRYCPDARDCFDFGTSSTLPESSLLTKLQSLFQQLSATQPLFLILHAPKADLEALQLLGMNTDGFITTLPAQGAQPAAGEIYVCDTQELFTGWQGQRRKEKLLTCCSLLGVDTTGARPHNAGECDGVLRVIGMLRPCVRPGGRREKVMLTCGVRVGREQATTRCSPGWRLRR